MPGRGMRRRGLSSSFSITHTLRTLHSEDFSFGGLCPALGVNSVSPTLWEGKFKLISRKEAGPPGLRHLPLPQV